MLLTEKEKHLSEEFRKIILSYFEILSEIHNDETKKTIYHCRYQDYCFYILINNLYQVECQFNSSENERLNQTISAIITTCIDALYSGYIEDIEEVVEYYKSLDI